MYRETVSSDVIWRSLHRSMQSIACGFIVSQMFQVSELSESGYADTNVSTARLIQYIGIASLDRSNSKTPPSSFMWPSMISLITSCTILWIEIERLAAERFTKLYAHKGSNALFKFSGHSK